MSIIHPHRNGFKSGVNHYSDTLEKTGMDFDILVLNENDNWAIEDSNKEIAVVIVGGRGTIGFQGEEFSFDRPDWINGDPTVVHMSPGENVKVSTKSQSRIAVIKTINDEAFKGKIYLFVVLFAFTVITPTHIFANNFFTYFTFK